MDIVYLDRLSFFSLLSVLRSRIEYSHIFYFNAAKNAEKAVKFFTRLKLLKVEPQPAEFILADVKDEKGECQLAAIVEDVRNISLRIREKDLINDSFLNHFSSHFDINKVLLFFEKIHAEQIYETVVFIRVSKWHAFREVNSQGKNVVFFLEKDLWSAPLSERAFSLNVRLHKYNPFVKSRSLRYYSFAQKYVLSKLRAFSLRVEPKEKTRQNCETAEATSSFSRDSGKGPLVASWYSCKPVTFSLKQRSDFFWLLKSKIPRQQVLVYFDRPDLPVTEETAAIMEEAGVRAIALSSNATELADVPVWSPTAKYDQLRKSLIAFSVKNYISEIARANFIPFSHLVNMVYFCNHYAYWYDFFSANEIKINLNPTDIYKNNIPMVSALENSGGISISYQWSNWNLSSLESSNSANVFFSFGPSYREVLEKNRSAIDHLIYCGYITDYSFKEVKEDVRRLRRQLIEKGAGFIICYFDENSSDDRMSVVTNSQSASVYRSLLELVLKDETLGLICSPKRPKTLFERLPDIESLSRKAIETGRCLFMGGEYTADNYPTEAAQASDLVITLLLGGTVALESSLSGAKVVFLDLEGLYSYPVYPWGEGKVVFDNIDDLLTAIKKFKANPKSNPTFGDLSKWVGDKDSFRDGNASLRIGQYLDWLLEMFSQGKSRDEALEYANQKYAELWGKENIVRIGFKESRGQGGC